MLWNQLDHITSINSLRSSPCGSSAGPGGCTYDHLKLLQDESDATEFLVATCNLLAQGKVPAEIRAALMGARLTALLKPNGGVRGIATGCTVRRLVARTLAKQFMKAFEAECALFNTPSPPEQEQTVWATCSGQPPTPTQT